MTLNPRTGLLLACLAGAVMADGEATSPGAAPATRPAGITADAALKQMGDMGRDALAADRTTVVGKDDWLFLSSELRHMGAGPFWGDAAAKASQATKFPDPLPAIVNLHQRLDKLGIKLLVVPVPARATVYADKLVDGTARDATGRPMRMDANHQAFYAKLREAHVNLLDLTDDFLAARSEDARLGPVCCEQDTHWSPRGITIAAERIAEAIGKPDWLAQARPVATHLLPPTPLKYKGDLVERTAGHAATLSTTVVAQVSGTPGTFTAVADDSDSLVLLLADSHGLVFHSGGDMHSEGSGLSDVLTRRLGVPIDLMARRGSGASVRIDLARRFIQDPAAAAKKRVVVYVFAANALTESDSWRPVPMAKE